MYALDMWVCRARGIQGTLFMVMHVTDLYLASSEGTLCVVNIDEKYEKDLNDRREW